MRTVARFKKLLRQRAAEYPRRPFMNRYVVPRATLEGVPALGQARLLDETPHPRPIGAMNVHQLSAGKS
jgi:hypothetical protein